MRPLALLTTPIVLVVLQQLVSIWFLIDFFLARDSMTISNFRKTTRSNDPSNQPFILDKVRRICSTTSDEDPTFDKVILIVIDALGSQFLPILSHHQKSEDVETHHQYAMPFVEKLISQDKGIGFIAKAATPTVTMPRIKALLSGTIPSFMDVVYNLASDVRDFHDDNILRIARANNKSLVFYGDDTWLSLFPRDIFLRVKETYSFFASDYTTVDTNVTEMALPEVSRVTIDWDYLLLHYLGLDHIGHIFGHNKGPLLNDKLREMDQVIQEIHSNMIARDHKTLMIVCGDHGMSKGGNHGGDSNIEAETAMLFLPIGRNLRQPRKSTSHLVIHQIDFAVTLSLLTGLPIPNVSRGVVINRLLESLWFGDDRRIMCATLENVLQLATLADHTLENNSSSLTYVEELNNSLKLFEDEQIQKDQVEKSESMKLATQRFHQLAKKIQTKFTQATADRSDPIKLVIAIVFVTLLTFAQLRKSCLRLLLPLMPAKERLICLISLLIPILMQGSTGYIESENLIWPIYSLVIFLFICLVTISNKSNYFEDVSKIRVLLFVVTFIITATWNNFDLFRSHSNWILSGLSVLILCNFSRQTSKMSGPRAILFYATGMAIFASKMIEETSESHQHSILNLAVMQVATLLLILIETLVNIIYGDKLETSLIQKLATAWMWLSFLLARSSNFIFLIANLVMEVSVNNISNSLRLSPITRAVVYIQFATNAFYGQGNTNLFSSIDIKPAFYGQTRYHLSLAIPLVAYATFAAQIYWYIKLFQRIQGEKEQESMLRGHESIASIASSIKIDVRSIIDSRNFLSIAYFMLVCVLLKNHLFIWSVISPKLLYHYVSNLILQLATISISFAPIFVSKLLKTNNQDVQLKRNQFRLI